MNEFVVYTITFDDDTVEWWMYHVSYGSDEAAKEVQGLIDAREAIPGAPKVKSTTRRVGLVYQKTLH